MSKALCGISDLRQRYDYDRRESHYKVFQRAPGPVWSAASYQWQGLGQLRGAFGLYLYVVKPADIIGHILVHNHHAAFYEIPKRMPLVTYLLRRGARDDESEAVYDWRQSGGPPAR